MIDFLDAIESWEDTVEHFLAYEDAAEIEGGLINRACVKDLVSALSSPLRHRLEAADREFIRIRPILVERFPTEFDPKYWGATEDEWWWWPDRLPAELAHTQR